MYKWTIFLLRADGDEKSVLLHTLNSAVITLENKELEQVEKFISGKSKDNDIILKLIEMGFLVADSYDEKKSFLELLNAELKDNKHLTLHILPTTGCNFACPYCYQCGINRHSFLSDETLKNILEYIDVFLEDKDITEATVVLHGGEPTVYWKPVITLLPKLSKIFKKYKVKYRTQIVSNGYNLTPEKSDLLSQYNWQRFQVTLDGPPKIHNKRRILANGGESFDQIIKNIEYILDNNKIEKVSIRINYDKNNIEYIPDFLKYLSEKFDKDRIILSLGFISKTIDDTDANKYVSEFGITLDEVSTTYLTLYKAASDLGFEMPDLFMFDGMCTSKLDNAMVISADGSIYKCLSGVGRDDFVVGKIEDKPKSLPNYLFPELYDQCLDNECEFLPLCNTGCRFNAYLENGKINSISCKRDVLIKVNKEILKYKYLERSARN
jgi:uncharacterized protein